MRDPVCGVYGERVVTVFTTSLFAGLATEVAVMKRVFVPVASLVGVILT